MKRSHATHPSSAPERASESAPTGGSRAGAACRALWYGNIALGALIGTAYLRGFALDASTQLWIFAYFGLVSAVATLSIAPASCVWLLRRARIGARLFEVGLVVTWTLFQLALIVDTRVWGLFRYHFNSAAWNLVTSKGSEDSYRLGAKVWLFALGCALVIGGAQWAVWRVLTSPRRRSIARQRLLRPGTISVALIVLAVCVEKSIYARADFQQDRQVAAVSEAFPVYPRLRVLPMLPDSLKEQIDVLPEVVVARSDAHLELPSLRVGLPRNGARPNILMLVIDSWRRDMLEAEVTPNMARFAGDARRFEDHLSTGNGTRFGVFGLLYGLHGSYWWPVLEARRAPPLLSALRAGGYETRVLSAASMDYPEFRETAWVDFRAEVWDDFGDAPSSVRDERVAERFERWLGERDAAQPFFAFVLLDSAHQKYDFPAEDALFTPYARDVDYVEMAGSRDPELAERVKNRYRNALHHADSVAARMLSALRASGEFDDTLIIVTGDHGEEFVENGYWGHTGNFTPEQVAVPFLMRGPGVPNGVELRPTSHVDLAGTLLELLGVPEDDVAAVSFSHNLLEPLAHRDRVVAGWEEVGLWTDDGVFRVQRDRAAGLGAIACDRSWRPLADQRAAFQLNAAALRRLSEECCRFLSLEPSADVALSH